MQVHYIALIHTYKYRFGELAVYILEIDPGDVFIGKGVDNHIVFQGFYIENIDQRDAIITPIGTNINTLGIGSL